MIVPIADLTAVLKEFNPWWGSWGRGALAHLPNWRRAAFHEINHWLINPPAHRALLVSGARQIGKTTLLLQNIDELLKQGVPPSRILYATFDHPLLKLAGLQGLVELWRSREPDSRETEYLFLDEIQHTDDWQIWLKHQVDFQKNRRIVVTGSATPLLEKDQESGVGRWHTVRLATLSFFEYLRIKGVATPAIPELPSLANLFQWSEERRAMVGQEARELVGRFHEYLLRGGFPQTALVPGLFEAQRLLREDIVDKVLKRDMTALFGVRRVVELERLFLYLCMHDGGMLDMAELCRSLQVTKPTAANYLNLLEAAHLIRRLAPHGYGKEILRARHKVYLADPGIAPSVMLKGESLLENPAALGATVETAFVRHVVARYYRQGFSFSYWRGGPRQVEVDIIAESQGRLTPFEVKYLSGGVQPADLKGLAALCRLRQVDRAYVITRDPTDFGPIELRDCPTRIMKIPAPLACHWLGESELAMHQGRDEVS